MTTQTESVRITGPHTDAQSAVLTPQANEFLVALHTRFEPVRQALLQERKNRQARLDAGELPHFLESTRATREASWKVAPIPADLLDRRVEITGPPDRKMTINALNSGASVFMADFEDSNSPTWTNNIEGQRNLYDAVRRTIEYTSPEGKEYKLNPKPAVLFVRPRGWHLNEKHFLVNGTPISGSLFDLGLFFFHNAKAQIAAGTGPYFYLPKLESHYEARLWNDVFVFAQDYIGIPQGSIRATVLIETITAAFEMDEILYELRDHSAGLNCGRWDYIFSFIKKFRNHASRVLPDRGVVTMQQPFLRSYVELLIHTCHRRGIHAMGGMAAQIPIRNNPKANEEAMERVRHDKLREVRAGHDGTWVAHPGLVPIAKQIFDEHMPQPNQIAPPANAHFADYRGQPAGVAHGRHHRRRTSPQHRRRLAVSGVVAARQRLRPDLRPDGRRRHRGDFSFADLAVAPLQRQDGRRTRHYFRDVRHDFAGGGSAVKVRRDDAQGSQVRPRGRIVYRDVER